MTQMEKELPSHFRKPTSYFCKGLLYFHSQDLPNAEKQMHLALMHPKDPFLDLDARGYLLCIYYETGNFTGMESLSNSFRLLLRRHKKLSPDRLENYQAFLRFFKRLAGLPPGKTKRAAKLRSEIIDSPYWAGKDWLLKKLDQIQS